MESLFLADLGGMSEDHIKEHLIKEYEADESDLLDLSIIIAYESVGSWGCDSSSFFLFVNNKTDELFELHGSHCSCHGFEGQFFLEKTDKQYLLSDHFGICTGGYDDFAAQNVKTIKDFIKKSFNHV